MGKSSQTVRSYYCNSCQTLSQYNADITIDSCALQNEYITDTIWNQMVERLQALENFGDYDSSSKRKPINASNIPRKENYEVITYDDYAKILNSIEYTQNIGQYDKILGTYSNELKNKISEYKIPTTRYAHTTCIECCDDCEYSCQGCYTCQGCNTCQGCYSHTPCTVCDGQAQNRVSISYGSGCPPCNRLQ